MAFISVPEENFVTDILKTWLTLFSSNAELQALNCDLVIRKPDIDKNFAMPRVVLQRVGKVDWALTRLSGFHGRQPTDPNLTPEEQLLAPTLGRLMGYTFTTTYQFDVYATNIGELNEIVAILNKVLKSADSSDVFANKGGAVQTVIPVVHFATPQDVVGTATDLKIRFRYWKDVENVEKSGFDDELHQYSIAVSFRCDYLKEYELPKINTITQDITI